MQFHLVVVGFNTPGDEAHFTSFSGYYHTARSLFYCSLYAQAINNCICRLLRLKNAIEIARRVPDQSVTTFINT